jgi:4-aminobutyrate aminotransferase
MVKHESLPIAPHFVTGDGVWLHTAAGARYLDAISGTFNLPLGYGHPSVERAVLAQAQHLVHVSSHFAGDQVARLIARLSEHAPPGLTRGWFRDNSGSTANECAVRIAQKATGRTEVITLYYSHHGQSHFATALSASAFRRKGFPGSASPLSLKVPAPFCHRCFYNARPSSCGMLCVDRIDDILEHTSSDDVACMIVEPVLGNGGNIVPPPGYLERVRRFCDERGILLVFDEVQTGIGRTGHMFAATTFGVTPDMIVLGKGLGGVGFPIAGVLMREALDVLEAHEHSFTSGSNLVGFAAAHATLDVVTEPGFLDEVRRKGERLGAHLRALGDECDLVDDVRGVGMMWGLEIVDRLGRPDPAGTRRLIDLCLHREQLITRASRYGRGNVLKVRPALTASDDDLEEIVARLRRALRAFARSERS